MSRYESIPKHHTGQEVHRGPVMLIRCECSDRLHCWGYRWASVDSEEGRAEYGHILADHSDDKKERQAS